MIRDIEISRALPELFEIVLEVTLVKPTIVIIIPFHQTLSKSYKVYYLRLLLLMSCFMSYNVIITTFKEL